VTLVFADCKLQVAASRFLLVFIVLWWLWPLLFKTGLCFFPLRSEAWGKSYFKATAWLFGARFWCFQQLCRIKYL